MAAALKEQLERADYATLAFEGDAALIDRFELGLARVGYSPAHADRYRAMTFQTIDERMYRVGNGFPRLTPASFVGGVPVGVERIEYEINLGSAEALCVARHPSGLPRELTSARSQT